MRVLKEIIYESSETGPRAVAEEQVDAQWWEERGGRVYFGSLDITDWMTGPHPKFAFEEVP